MLEHLGVLAPIRTPIQFCSKRVPPEMQAERTDPDVKVVWHPAIIDTMEASSAFNEKHSN